MNEEEVKVKAENASVVQGLPETKLEVNEQVKRPPGKASPKKHMYRKVCNFLSLYLCF